MKFLNCWNETILSRLTRLKQLNVELKTCQPSYRAFELAYNDTGVLTNWKTTDFVKVYAFVSGEARNQYEESQCVTYSTCDRQANSCLQKIVGRFPHHEVALQAKKRLVFIPHQQFPLPCSKDSSLPKAIQGLQTVRQRETTRLKAFKTSPAWNQTLEPAGILPFLRLLFPQFCFFPCSCLKLQHAFWCLCWGLIYTRSHTHAHTHKNTEHVTSPWRYFGIAG